MNLNKYTVLCAYARVHVLLLGTRIIYNSLNLYTD